MNNGVRVTRRYRSGENGEALTETHRRNTVRKTTVVTLPKVV